MSRLLALCVIAALSGCASAGAATAGQEFTMSVGQQVSLPDAARLHYAGIANDSRCPPDVQCIRAGDADVLFDYAPRGSVPARIILNTERARTSTVGAWQLRLVDLAQGPMPQATVRIDAATGATTP